jgi:hypothetical protein
MKNSNFSALLYDIVDKMTRTLEMKGIEYASSNDRLHNFKVAARIDDETPEKALWGMLKKHLVSVMDLVDNPWLKIITPEYLAEKFGDARNYLTLLEALLLERHGYESYYSERQDKENTELTDESA